MKWAYALIIRWRHRPIPRHGPPARERGAAGREGGGGRGRPGGRGGERGAGEGEGGGGGGGSRGGERASPWREHHGRNSCVARYRCSQMPSLLRAAPARPSLHQPLAALRQIGSRARNDDAEFVQASQASLR